VIVAGFATEKRAPAEAELHNPPELARLLVGDLPRFRDKFGRSHRHARIAEKAGMQWNDNANVCGGKKAMGKPEEKSKKKEMSCHSSEKKRPQGCNPKAVPEG